MTQDRAPLTGHDLIEWGHRPGPGFGALLKQANALLKQGFGMVRIRADLAPLVPPPVQTVGLQTTRAFHANIEVEGPDEETNLEAVNRSMRALMRTPTLVAGAVMPDACPAGPVGTIPVGGVVAARNAIHPGMHSADICCSVMLTDLGDADPKAVLDAAQSVTHFGPGGRRDVWGMSKPLAEALRENPFTNAEKTLRLAETHMGTQGDGNHFLFVGRSRSTGRTALVSHHGSRGFGAMVYKAGMAAAEAIRAELSPATAKQNAWIPADTAQGRAYWTALQLIRDWTKANHTVLHDRTIAALGGQAFDRHWNEHNFVFERDGLFYHGKGATPAWDDYAGDATGLTLIPLNMAEPILVVRGSDAAHGLGFSPHGAGRNVSRSEHKRRMSMTPQQALAAETRGLDVRFFAGGVDASELPSSYKRAEAVTAQIKRFGLAEIVDYIDPYGCIMAGDIPPFWAKKKKARARSEQAAGGRA